MNHSSNVTTEADSVTVTVTEQRPPARVRPERPVRRLRRGTSPHPASAQEGTSSGETARRREAAAGAPPRTPPAGTVPDGLLQPSASSSQAWTTADDGFAAPDEHDEYDELLAAVLSDDDQTISLEDPAPAAGQAPDLSVSRDEAPQVAADGARQVAADGARQVAADGARQVAADEAAVTQAAETPGALLPTQQYPPVRVEAGVAASHEDPAAAETRALGPTQEADSSPLDELDSSRSSRVSLEAAAGQAADQAGDAVSADASTLAPESLPASRTRARRGRAASASAATHQEQPTASPLAPLENELAEPAPLPPAPLYVWQGATLLPTQTQAQTVSTSISAPDLEDHVHLDADVDEPTATSAPAPAGGLGAPHITDAVDASTATAPSTNLPKAHDGVSASPSTTAAAEPDKRTARAEATEAAAGETSSAAGREVSAPQISVPGAALDAAAFVRQVRDAELRDAAPVLSPVHAVPDGGWRSAVMKLTLGRVQPAPSARQAERDHEIYRVRTPLNGNRHVVVLAYGTGVGKTLTTGAIGLQFAEHRDDRVAVIDADQTAGNLADRFATPADRFLQDLLEEHQHSAVDSIVELRRYARSAKRLDIYSADHTRTYTAEQHRDALKLLSRFHDVVITDLGSSGLRDMPEVLQTATDVVVVTGTSMDAVDRSRKVLDRLEELCHERLAREAVVAMVTRTTKDSTLAKAARNGGVHVETLIGHFQKRCRATVLIPYSARLADGVHVDYETLDHDVNEAYLRIAGFLANGFRPALDREVTPEIAGASGRAQLPTIHPAATSTTPATPAKIKLGRGRRRGLETPRSSAFAELPHYQGS